MMSAKVERRRVLVVDDDHTNIDLITSILEENYDVRSAYNGEDALELIRSGEIPDIILLDVMMPKMDGYTVCKCLQSDPATAGIPIVFVSALHSPGDEARGLRLGAMDYISKPIAPAIVLLRVKTQLELKAHREQLEQLVAAKASQLKKAYDELKELDRLKSALLDSVSHELRTPLTSVIGFAKVSAKKLSSSVLPVLENADDRKGLKAGMQVLDNLHHIADQAEHLSQQVHNVMELSELVAKNLMITATPLDIGPLLCRSVAMAREMLREQLVTVEADIAPNLPRVLGNAQRLEQVLGNLFSNAIKFIGTTGAIVCTAATVGNEVVVSIRDSGPGIPTEEQERVFQYFKQLGDSMTGKPKGLGIGLSLSQIIMERMGGRIWLSSEVGKGSVFSIALPVCSKG